MSRGVSAASIPTRDLNHWRWVSTRLTSAIGVPQIRAADTQAPERPMGAQSDIERFADPHRDQYLVLRIVLDTEVPFNIRADGFAQTKQTEV